jgi:hypothetical protein
MCSHNNLNPERHNTSFIGKRLALFARLCKKLRNEPENQSCLQRDSGIIYRCSKFIFLGGAMQSDVNENTGGLECREFSSLLFEELLCNECQRIGWRSR